MCLAGAFPADLGLGLFRLDKLFALLVKICLAISARSPLIVRFDAGKFISRLLLLPLLGSSIFALYGLDFELKSGAHNKT